MTRQRWRLLQLVTVLAVLALLGVVAGRLLLTPVTGNLVVLASARQADDVASSSVAIHNGSGWHDLGRSSAQTVPKAPQTATVAQTSAPVGSYDAIRLGGDTLPASIEVQKDQLTSVLVAVAGGHPQKRGVYSGAQQVSLGLNELAGQFRQMPAFSLVDQFSRPFTNETIAGHVVVLAAFHTTCQETCPLYTGLFAQLRRQLPPSVQLVEATINPQHDTPEVLRDYAGRVGASWSLVTGTPAAMTDFWKPLDVQLSSGDVHQSTLAVIDSHGYVRTYFQGTPDVGGSLPGTLRSLLNEEGQSLLTSRGDGWGASQIVDALQALGGTSPAGANGEGPAPGFSLKTLDGRTVNLADYRGRPVLINFWASWCVPCREEMPLIERTAAGHPKLVVLLVDQRDSPQAARSFVQQLGIRSTVLFDGQGEVGDRYAITGLPTTIFVRSDGSIEGRYIGETNAQVLASHIAAIEA